MQEDLLNPSLSWPYLQVMACQGYPKSASKMTDKSPRGTGTCYARRYVRIVRYASPKWGWAPPPLKFNHWYPKLLYFKGVKLFMQHFYGKTGRPERLGKDHIIPTTSDNHIHSWKWIAGRGRSSQHLPPDFFARFNLLQSLLLRCCTQCPSQDLSGEFHLGRSSISDLTSLDKMTTCLEIATFSDLVDPFTFQWWSPER